MRSFAFDMQSYKTDYLNNRRISNRSTDLNSCLIASNLKVPKRDNHNNNSFSTYTSSPTKRSKRGGSISILDQKIYSNRNSNRNSLTEADFKEQQTIVKNKKRVSFKEGKDFLKVIEVQSFKAFNSNVSISKSNNKKEQCRCFIL
jgi:hypothetical protein